MSLELHLNLTMKLEKYRTFFPFFFLVTKAQRITKLKHKIHFEATTVGTTEVEPTFQCFMTSIPRLMMGRSRDRTAE